MCAVGTSEQTLHKSEQYQLNNNLFGQVNEHYERALSIQNIDIIVYCTTKSTTTMILIQCCFFRPLLIYEYTFWTFSFVFFLFWLFSSWNVWICEWNFIKSSVFVGINDRTSLINTDSRWGYNIYIVLSLVYSIFSQKNEEKRRRRHRNKREEDKKYMHKSLL